MRSIHSSAGTPISIPTGLCELRGDLAVPDSARGIVVFAHGSASSRMSPRNKYVASVLYDGKIATLLVDLLTHEEEQLDDRTGALRFDVPMLGDRLVKMIDWLSANKQTAGLKIGLFGASTGAAAAIVAATHRRVNAVVSRGGRVDLAKEALRQLQAPALFIVGSMDYSVLELNREAIDLICCRKELAVIAGATHLFEEAGALEQVSVLARDWFIQHLR